MSSSLTDNQTLGHLAKRLTNLSSANRLLYLPRLRLGHELDFRLLDWQLGKSAAQLRNQLVNGASKILLTTITDARNDDSNILSRALLKLARQDLFIQQEQGTHDLHIGYPFVVGSLAAGVLIKAPLVLFPCQLIQQDGKWVLDFKDQEPPYLNPTFLLAWSHYTGQQVPQALFDAELLPVPTKEAEPDHVAFITMLYKLLEQHGLDIKLGAEVMADPVLNFDLITKADIEVAAGVGMLEMKPLAILGLFRQPDGYLEQDYEAFIAANKSVESFFETEGNDLPIREADTYLPLPIDSSQWQAVLAIRRGQPLVVQGPPGSGKSQLITNLIADYISRGKTVALICQKRVALDVVARRLESLGLRPWVALVHDYKEERRDLFAQLKAQVDQIGHYQQDLNTLSVLKLEQQYQSVSKQLEQVLSTLGEVKQQLYAIGPAGVSAKQLYQLVGQPASMIALWPKLKGLGHDIPTYPVWLDQQLQLGILLKYRHQIDVQAYQWLLKALRQESDRPSWQHHTIANFEALNIDPIRIEAAINKLPNGHSIAHLTELTAIHAAWVVGRNAAEAIDLVAAQRWTPKLGKQVSALIAKINGAEVAIPHLKGIKPANIDHLSLLVSKAKSANFLWQLFWKFGGTYKAIKSVLGSWVDDLNRAKLIMMLEVEIKAWQHYHLLIIDLDHLTDYKGLRLTDHLPNGKWVSAIEARNQALAQVVSNWPINALFGVLTSLHEADQQVLAYQTLKAASQGLTVWLGYDLANQLWWHEDERLLRNLAALSAIVQDLAAYDAYVATTQPWMQSMAQLLIPIDQAFRLPISVDTQLADLEASLISYWIAEVEHLNPALKQMGQWQLTEQETQLQALLQQKQSLAKQLVVVRLKERSCLGLEYNRLQNRITYRNLYDQVTKRQRLWPLRKLLATYPDDILRLTPCWLTSPEAMAAMFESNPASGPPFDLVIVDEASQCYAERGLPALARGKQVVVVGDRMQLQPFNLYQVRYEASDEDLDANPDLDSQSLLDLASRYAATLTLTGHYRSQNQSLIAFSNHHFYDGRLQYLPSPAEVAAARDLTNIEAHYVQGGIWDKQANQTEAEAVVTYLVNLLNTPSYQQNLLDTPISVGVITFNIHQQERILDLLEDRLQAIHQTIPPHWFIKSLEHVQGDEADIIVFSVAYAADPVGRIRAQYGSLSKAGGENRLNVGITRARQKLVVFSSLLPHQLPTDDSTHAGPRLLKAWLHYVWQVGQAQAQTTIPTELQRKPPQPTSLAARLQTQALDVALIGSLLPVADLFTPSETWLTDDDRFATQPDARAEFGLNPMALMRSGWAVRRFWERQR